MAASTASTRVNHFAGLTRKHGLKCESIDGIPIEAYVKNISAILKPVNIIAASRVSGSVIVFLDSVNAVETVCTTGLSVGDCFTHVQPLVNLPLKCLKKGHIMRNCPVSQQQTSNDPVRDHSLPNSKTRPDPEPRPIDQSTIATLDKTDEANDINENGDNDNNSQTMEVDDTPENVEYNKSHGNNTINDKSDDNVIGVNVLNSNDDDSKARDKNNVTNNDLNDKGDDNVIGVNVLNNNDDDSKARDKNDVTDYDLNDNNEINENENTHDTRVSKSVVNSSMLTGAKH
uniref:GATA zinc finger domain-containing protein 4-like n=1 Tax=Saccoglossus kowalevskii TaxID=10224 RepID=A0ABM0M7G6_SACKO|nr:PREDICTED: GATA zinc finger domain-containing protein 4-like [Saccoglossus kowalevskii]